MSSRRSTILEGAVFSIRSLASFLLWLGRTISHDPASLWPPAFHQPWMSTSIHKFWSFRWRQTLRYRFITLGARPDGMLLRKPGAIMGAFAVSAVSEHHRCLVHSTNVSGLFVFFQKGMEQRVTFVS
ncbi:hypothetical protein BC827DRAFT_403048 [Russula dissimulans]|nr:hypothetical protein BC827DRAFT_403048 [Russula dissimulans]